MKSFFQLFANFFHGSVGKILIVANFVVCLIVFDWAKFGRYLETPARFNCHLKSIGGGIDFSVYGFYGGSYSAFENVIYSIITIILFPFAGLFFILVYPSIAITEIVLGILKGMFPLWCLETFDVFYIPVFAVVNAFYWLFLGDMIEIAYSAYLQRKPAYKPLSIFSDSN